MKGQVSTELLVIVGFMLFLLIPTIIYTYYKAKEYSYFMELKESDLTAARLAYMINALGSSGDNNALKVEFDLPDSIEYLSFRDYGIGGEVYLKLKNYTISYPTKFGIVANQTYNGGSSYKLEFYSLGNKIYVKYV